MILIIIIKIFSLINLFLNRLDVGEFVTTIMLDHTLYTGLAGQQVLTNRQPAPSQRPTFNPQPAFNPQQQQTYNPQQQQQQTYNPQPQQQAYNPQPPQTRPPQTRPPQTTSRPIASFENIGGGSNERLNEFSSQCGVPKHRVQDSTGLVVNGKAATKGQVSKTSILN